MPIQTPRGQNRQTLIFSLRSSVCFFFSNLNFSRKANLTSQTSQLSQTSSVFSLQHDFKSKASAKNKTLRLKPHNHQIFILTFTLIFNENRDSRLTTHDSVLTTALSKSALSRAHPIILGFFLFYSFRYRQLPPALKFSERQNPIRYLYQFP